MAFVKMGTPKEIVDGLFHWTGIHPEIGIRVSSYYLAGERVLVDPLLPSPRGIAWLRKHGPPEHILLTNRLHSRQSAKLVAAFGCTVWCNRAGLSHLAASLKVRPFDAGDELPGGVRAFGIGGICPDESALLLPRVRAAAVADGVIRRGNGPLAFVPDDLLVDDPRDAGRVKRELRAAYRRLAKRRFEHLLMAHGNPWLHDGRAALRAWAGR
ncbi:MAG: MBL fold metallo-hydrolase [Acidobacteria bacterium]|nr:MBL fold metallo-hydrolase [Acidobacteriota bacterium]